MVPEKYIQTEAGKRMFRAVTPIYTDEYQLSIFNANGLIMEEVQGIANKINAETLISQATWSLPYWEELFRVRPKDSYSIEQRRRNVISKMNEYFPVTKKRLESIVNNFVSGNNAFIEDPSHIDYSFAVVIPMENKVYPGLREAVDETKPAHLLALYELLAESIMRYQNDSYSYPVYYKKTNEFWGEVTTVNSEVGKVCLGDSSYSYPVYYDVNTIQFKNMDTKSGLGVVGDNYSYPIYYPECGEFEAGG